MEKEVEIATKLPTSRDVVVLQYKDWFRFDQIRSSATPHLDMKNPVRVCRMLVCGRLSGEPTIIALCVCVCTSSFDLQGEKKKGQWSKLILLTRPFGKGSG
jgi:hypothetical protein